MKNEDLENSEHLARTRSGARARWIAVIMLILLIGFGVWANIAPLAKGIVAHGTVIVDSRRKTIQHLEGGLVQALHVLEGTKVKENDLLLELDSTRARADRDMVRARYWMKLAALDRLKAQQAGTKKLAFRSELTAHRDNSIIQELLLTQTRLFEVLRREQEGKQLILGQRIEQLKEKVRGLNASQSATKNQIALLDKELKRLQQLQTKHLIESSVVMDRLQLLTQQQGELGRTASALAETHIAIGEAQLNLVQAEKEWQQTIADDMSKLQGEAIELRSQLEAAENILKRTKILAPQAGIVLGLKIHTIGGVIAAGNPIMDIVPQGDELVIEARVLPLDVDSITPGMQAQVRFSSFRTRTTPQLDAQVERVSADAITDPVKGELFYLASIKVNPGEMVKLGEHVVIPGMPAEVFIDAGSRTMLEYLLDPLVAVFQKGLREE